MAFWAGVRAVGPLLLGTVPFAMIAGTGAIEAGLSRMEAVGMSLVVFAGVAQLAMVDLMARGAPWVVIALTGLVVNVRFVMYSAW